MFLFILCHKQQFGLLHQNLFPKGCAAHDKQWVWWIIKPQEEKIKWLRMFVKLIAGSHVCSALVVASWVAQLSNAAEESLLSNSR